MTLDSGVLKEIKACCQALDDKKAIDMRVLDVRGKSSITDYFILATATSDPHLRALRKAVEGRFKEAGVNVDGIDHEPQSGWLVVDIFDFMVHVFLQETRELYGLESLWKDAEELNTELFLDE